MVLYRIVSLLICNFICWSLFAQTNVTIDARFTPEKGSITMLQQIEFTNTSQQPIDIIYLQDWNHSYSDNETALATRLAEEFNTRFHFSKTKEKGYTVINNIQSEGQQLNFERLENQIDILKVSLTKPLAPNQRIVLNLNYDLHIPSSKFTKFGKTSANEFNLKNWIILPSYLSDTWKLYSNKDLDDQYTNAFNINLSFKIPKDYQIATSYNLEHTNNDDEYIQYDYTAKNNHDFKLYLYKKENPSFYEVETDNFTLISNISSKGVSKVDKSLIIDKIGYFLTDKLGAYPHKRIFITEEEYKRNPIYGLNQLPNFLRPFPNGFQYEIKVFKTLVSEYLDNSVQTNKRLDYWVKDAIQVYLLMDYVETYYPEMNLLGSLSKIWGIRSFHAADLKFNHQYSFLHLNMVRLQLDQKLTMPKDSLLKFNNNIAGKYKAGLGFRYLDNYLGKGPVRASIKDYFKQYKSKTASGNDFLTILKRKSSKDISWFYKDYIDSRKNIDYKIKKIDTQTDSIYFDIVNKTGTSIPILFQSFKDEKIIDSIWIDNVTTQKRIAVPNKNQNKFYLNKDQYLSDVEQRNNVKNLNKNGKSRKPFQFRIFQDLDDPNYNQVFYIPELGFNVYDGFSPGLKFYNRGFLRKPLEYKLKPMYGLRSKSVIGSFVVSYTFYNKFKNNFATRVGFSGSTFHYAEDLLYQRYSPFVNFTWRDQYNLRSNKVKALSLRYINVFRDTNPNPDPTAEEEEPNYGVFNARFSNSNREMSKDFSWQTDLQIAEKFGKASLSVLYKKLFRSQRQINLRFYAGSFLYHKEDSDFFDFALDRPTDYLFDYDYYGRSEDTGFFSQQLIIAEGGFKSKLTPSRANQWISTLNASTTIWKYVHAYGDIGLLKSENSNPAFVYDSGVRLNLVENYFEIYFPVYSNLGWEVSQARYGEKIRFLITLSPRSLLKLFKRKWY